ncbi:hypothetical protein [Micromonospora cathayae]|uniref:Phage shock protein B n=1 Tax=Micromonospora cathayae TaxID=3028804 RepID=A0ABY7ZJB9_9ACTN|nr:hypothetical protein [Micromonospora sp. HUAS 3]WDZ82377.1 hypothetical protein PVK37_17945 [Micromonospora sp. HUAS 3]
MMDGHDAAEIVGAIGIFAIIIIVLLAVIARIAPTWRARAELARDQEYRALAEQSAHTQQELTRQLGELSGRLTTMETRMSSIERTLREVD